MFSYKRTAVLDATIQTPKQKWNTGMEVKWTNENETLEWKMEHSEQKKNL